MNPRLSTRKGRTMRFETQHGNTTRNANGGARRGIALMLVLLVMGVAVIMGAALLTFDGGPAQASDNALSQVQADWAAEGTANQVVAAFEQGVDASTNAGDLVPSKSVGLALASVKVTNMKGDAPTDDDRELLMRAVANVKGVEARITRHIVLPTAVEDAYDAVDPYLNEFAIFGDEYIRADLGSQIAVWDLDPKTATSKWVNVGMGFEMPGSLSLAITPTSNVCFVADGTAHPLMSLVLDLYNVLGRGHALDANIPAVPAHLPGAITGLGTVGTPITNGAGSTRTVLSGGVYTSCTISNNSTTYFDETRGTHYVVSLLQVQSTGALVAQGDITIHVAGNMTVQNGGVIALADDASRLTILVDGDVIIDDATIGVPVDLARSGRGIADMTEWINPRRITMLGVRTADGGDSNPNWQINNNSDVVACWHAPNADFQLSNSTLAGRITARDVVLQTGARLLYSRSLDRGVGFSIADGPLFESRGVVTAGVRAALDGAVPADGLGVFSAALRGVDVDYSAKVESKTVDDDAADMEDRKTVADAGDDD